MGKKIDRLVLFLAGVAGLYLLFAAAFRSIPMALAATFIAAALFRNLAVAPRKKARKRRALAAETLTRWAKSPNPAPEIREVIENAYPGELAMAQWDLILRHPQGSPVTLDELFQLWKAHAGKERLVVAATCKADDKAHALADTLEHPRVRLLDANQLAELLKKTPLKKAESAQPEAKPRRVRAIRVTREQAPKRLLFGILLFSMYWILGNVLYLFAALATLFLSLAGFKKRKSPRKLFA